MKPERFQQWLLYVPQNPEIPAAVCTPERTVIIDQPRIIGERINPTGKKKLKEALKNGDMDYVPVSYTHLYGKHFDKNYGFGNVHYRRVYR